LTGSLTSDTAPHGSILFNAGATCNRSGARDAAADFA